MKKVLFLLCLCFFGAFEADAQLAIGRWRTHLTYDDISHLAVGDGRIYAAGKMSVMYYDRQDWSVGVLDKVSGLSDVGVATIECDTVSNCLIVAYTNSNIDIVKEGRVYNISDIKRSGLSGNKTIYSIRICDRMAYLACGFGLVVVDLERCEIKNTLYLGTSERRPEVYDVAFCDGFLYAATSEGLFRNAIDDPYPNVTTHWMWDSTLVVGGETLSHLCAFNHRILVTTATFNPDSANLYVYEGVGHYTRFDKGNIRSVRSSCGHLLVNKLDSIIFYNPTFEKERMLNGSDYWSGIFANDVLLCNADTLWMAHNWAGLLLFTLRDMEQPWAFAPTAPKNNNNVYRLVAYGDDLMLCPGGHHSTYANSYLPAEVCTLHDNQWISIEGTAKDTLLDIVDVAVSPLRPEVRMAASWSFGVVEIVQGKIKEVFNESNTGGALKPYNDGKFRSLRTGGLAFDADDNLWVVNSLSSNGLVVRRADGTWKGFDTYNMVGSVETDKILWDSITDYKWFYGAGNRIFVHDGEGKMAWVDPNNGSKRNTSTVNCVVQDRSGDLWVGTNNGIKVIYDGYKAFDNGGRGEKSPVTCRNIVIGNGEFVEYLMAYENITCMAVDGANRKWVGTAAGGLYLISANGLEEVQHFTMANSPLLSNKICAIAVMPYSGEVFVGTDKGLISYRGTATWAERTPQDDIHAFPNPIKPDYDGPVAIKGFTRDAQVHITDAAGHVVFSTEALGGQAIWNIRTNDGHRVASGVYFVFAADADGGNKSVTKILVIR